MDGRALFQSIADRNLEGPADYRAREDAIWQAVLDGHFILEWQPLEYETKAGGKVMLLVAADTLKIGDASSNVRVCVSQLLSQRIADHLGCVLPTAKLSDNIWEAADLKLVPPTQTWYKDQTMGRTSRMIEFHDIVERKIGGRSYATLAGHNKDWINSTLLGTPQNPAHAKEGGFAGCNYGWHIVGGGNTQSQTMPGVNVWQMPAIKHPYTHSDYSQQLRLVSRNAYVCRATFPVAGLGASGGVAQYGLPDDGQPCVDNAGAATAWRLYDIYDLVHDTDLHGVVEHERAVYELRHPAIPWPGDGKQSDPPELTGQIVQATQVSAGKDTVARAVAFAGGALLGHVAISAIRGAATKV